MLPAIQFLIAIFIGKVLTGAYEPVVEHPFWTPAGTALCILGLVPLGAWLRRRLRGRLDAARGDPEAWERTLLAVYRAQGRLRLSPLFTYVLICVVLGWPGYVAAGPFDRVLLGDEILAVMPFVAALFVVWVLQYRLERLLTGRGVALRPYLGFHGRQILLPVLPVMLMLGIWDAIEKVPAAMLCVAAYPFLAVAMVLVVVSGLFLLSGPLMRLIFGARRLPDGPLRDRLLGFARRAGFRHRDLLVWDTRLDVINAAIIGGTARSRYVLFTEGLLAHFTPAEVEAVFAHEIGHAKGFHLHFYFLFAVTLLFLWQLAATAFGWALPDALVSTVWVQIAFFSAMLVLYWRVIFGFVSRRFEREADLFAAGAVGEAGVFIDALEGVSRKSGGLRSLPSWRHYSIAQRTEFLRRAAADPGMAARFRRGARRVKIGLVVVLIASMADALRDVAPEFRAGSLFLEAVHAADVGDYARARAAVRRALQTPGLPSPFVNAVRAHAEETRPAAAGLGRELLVVDVLRRTELRGEAVARFAAVLGTGVSLLERGDLDGAIRFVKTVLDYRRDWDPMLQKKLDAFRRRVRRQRDRAESRKSL